MKENLKSLASLLLRIIVFSEAILVIKYLINGALYLSDVLFVAIAAMALFICVVILLSLASFKKTRSMSVLGFFIALYSVLALGILAGPRIIDGLTPVDALAQRYHERSKYEYRVGAICNDGWRSEATEQGACSHHGGVKEWVYQSAYKKTYEECRKEAEQTSWLK